MTKSTFTSIWGEVDKIDGWLSKVEGQLLFLLAKNLKNDSIILEIGSYKGRSTACLALGSHANSVYSIDPHSGDITQMGMSINTFPVFLENIKKFELENVNSYRMTSKEAFEKQVVMRIDLLFIDGWHSTEAVAFDISSWGTRLKRPSVILIDDFLRDSVYNGIVQSRNSLPNFIGWKGKIAVFSDHRMSQGVGVFWILWGVRKSLIKITFKKYLKRLLGFSCVYENKILSLR
jgi:predicted O-methyltransferase YrrM